MRRINNSRISPVSEAGRLSRFWNTLDESAEDSASSELRGTAENRRVPRSVGVATQHRATSCSFLPDRRGEEGRRRPRQESRAREKEGTRLRRTASALGVAAHASPRRRDAVRAEGREKRGGERGRERKREGAIGVAHSWLVIDPARSAPRALVVYEPPNGPGRCRHLNVRTRATRVEFSATLIWIPVVRTPAPARFLASLRTSADFRFWRARSRQSFPSPAHCRRRRSLGAEEAPLRELGDVRPGYGDDNSHRDTCTLHARPRGGQGRAAVRRDSERSMWKWILRALCTTLRGTASSSASRWVRRRVMVVARRDADVSAITLELSKSTGARVSLRPFALVG